MKIKNIRKNVEANKPKIQEQQKEYYTKNKPRIQEKEKENRKANKEKIQEYKKEYRELNKAKINEKVKCECACLVTKRHLKEHQSTKKHLNILKNMNAIIQ